MKEFRPLGLSALCSLGMIMTIDGLIRQLAPKAETAFATA